MNPIKKLTLAFLSTLIIVTSFLTVYAKPTFAQGPPVWYKQSYSDWVGIVEGGNPSELYGERYAAAQTRWVVYGLFYMLLENPYIACLTAYSTQAVTVQSCIDALIDSISPFSYQPVNTPSLANSSATYAYVRSIGERWNLVPVAEAQNGFGFDAASGMQELWRASRDTTYALLILMIIVMAFMIMFRVKISPQTVITVQSALPRVFIALILITFSYAIATFMIDLMYVAIGLLAGIINQTDLSDASWIEMYGQLTNQKGALSLSLHFFIIALGALTFAINELEFVQILGAAGGGTAGLVATLVVFVLGVVLLIIAFRTWWMLLKNFVMILLQIVFGPIVILFGGWSNWIKNLAMSLAVYPMVGFMYFLAFLFLKAGSDQTAALNGGNNFYDQIIRAVLANQSVDLWPFGLEQSNSIITSSDWVPPLTGTTLEGPIVWIGVSIALLALIPKASDIIKGFASGRGFDTGRGIGEGLAFAGGAGAWAAANAKGTLERNTLGRLGLASAQRLSRGKGNMLDSFIARQAMTRGHINVGKGLLGGDTDVSMTGQVRPPTSGGGTPPPTPGGRGPGGGTP